MKRKRRSFRIAALLCILALMFTGCAKPVAEKTDKNGNRSTDSVKNEKNGTQDSGPGMPGKDHLVIAVDAEPQTMDPAMIGQNTQTAVGMYTVYETLLTEKNGDALTLEPQLAESYEMSEDGRQITFKLRENVKFHNGETMTAGDVAFSFNRAIESPYTESITGTMDHMEVVDNYTVRLYLKNAYLPILQCVANYNLGILSKKAVEDAEAAGVDYARNPVGTNAYKFVKWSGGSKMEFERFDDYWREPAPFKTLTILILSDNATAAIALENNEIDVLWQVAKNDLRNLESLPNVTVDKCSGVGYNHVFFNCSQEGSPFMDQRVRQAVAQVINREEMVAAAAEGYAAPLECPVPSTLEGYDPDFKFWTYDVEGAKQLMADAGYPDGFSCTMKLSSSGAENKKIGQILQAELHEIGIEMEIEYMEKAAWDQIVRMDSNYEISVAKFNAHYQDADYILWHRLTSYTIGNLCNFYGVTSDRIDEVLDKARYSLDQEERNVLYREVFDYVRDTCCIIPVYEGLTFIAYNSNLTGVYAHPNMRIYPYYIGLK